MPKTFRKVFGSSGEALAVEFLKRRGLRILELNFQCRTGEIDIIAQDKDTICFVEVKARKTSGYGSGLEAVSFFKQQRIVKAALYYLARQGWEERFLRFDVILVETTSDESPHIEYLENAFEPDGFD